MSSTRVLAAVGSFAEAEHCVACQAPLLAARCHECGTVHRVRGYRVLRVLSRSPHSRVYLAEDASGRRVALKELLFAAAPELATISAFEREAVLLKALDHPAIPKLVASFQEGSGPGLRLYLAQELVVGETLLDHLERRPFSSTEARAVGLRVLDILDWLHSRTPPILHRDIKPQNLIVRPNGSLALVDFGSAREVPRGYTHGATLVGTFGYMSPEQLGGTVGSSSDLYALGATLIHLLTGKPPETLFNPATLTLELEPWITSERWREVLRKMVARDPANRFASIDAARVALEDVRAAPEPQKQKGLTRIGQAVRALTPSYATFMRFGVTLTVGLLIFAAGRFYGEGRFSPWDALTAAAQTSEAPRTTPSSLPPPFEQSHFRIELEDTRLERGDEGVELDLFVKATHFWTAPEQLRSSTRVFTSTGRELMPRLDNPVRPTKPLVFGALERKSWVVRYDVPDGEDALTIYAGNRVSVLSVPH